MEKNELVENDLKYIWHPYTQMKDFENENPIIIERGEGIYLYDIDGNRYIDAVSSWWVNTLGHSNERLNEALYEQAKKVEHVMLAGFSHQPAIELAKKLIEISAPNLTKVFYSDNGSTAVEVALKMAYQYCLQTNKGKKSKFVALQYSYHGDTLGTVSVGGVDLYHKIYKPLLFDIFQADSPYCYRCPMECEKESCNIECIKSVEEIFDNHHNEICAIIIEPLVQGAGGFIIYPSEYLKKLRALCDKYDILLIDDEVAMGFLRTGKMFAYEHAQIEPDIVCVAKGITAGYMPLAATIVSDKIYDAFYDNYENCKTFYHGHSYTGNPLACAVAVENLKILEEENIAEQIQIKSKILFEQIQSLSTLDIVGDIRHIGMIAAIELVKDKKTKEPFSLKDRIDKKLFHEALKLGVIIRPLGGTIYLMLPYVINSEQIIELVNIVRDAIKSVSGTLLYK